MSDCLLPNAHVGSKHRCCDYWQSDSSGAACVVVANDLVCVVICIPLASAPTTCPADLWRSSSHLLCCGSYYLLGTVFRCSPDPLATPPFITIPCRLRVLASPIGSGIPAGSHLTISYSDSSSLAMLASWGFCPAVPLTPPEAGVRPDLVLSARCWALPGMDLQVLAWAACELLTQRGLPWSAAEAEQEVRGHAEWLAASAALDAAAMCSRGRCAFE